MIQVIKFREVEDNYELNVQVEGKYELTNDNTLKLTKAQQDEIQQQRETIIRTIEGDAISPAARKLLEEHKQRMISKQKSEKLSKKNLDLYVNIDKENPNNAEDNIMPAIEKRVIKLNAPDDEDLGL